MNALKTILLKCGFVRENTFYRCKLPDGSTQQIDQYEFVDKWPKYADGQTLEEYLKYLSDMATKQLGYKYQYTSEGIIKAKTA